MYKRQARRGAHRGGRGPASPTVQHVYGELMQGLGGLEAEVMNVLWSIERPLSVHDVVEAVTETSGRLPAYTTILTVVTHLHRKGWVQREKRSRAFYYAPSSSRAEATAHALRALLDDSGNTDAVLLHIAKTVTDPEFDALRRGRADESL